MNFLRDYEFVIDEDGTALDTWHLCSEWHPDAQVAENEALVRCGAFFVTPGNEAMMVGDERFDVKRVDGMHQYRIKVQRPHVPEEDLHEWEDGS